MTEQATSADDSTASAHHQAKTPCGCSDEQVERIYAYLDGALTVDDIKKIADHLENCEDCTHESELEQVIRTAVKRSCSETAPETLKSTIRQRIQQECGQPLKNS
ncbi:MAG: mycothiol system anti-sigma-R factor [Kocuria sp.]|nr:mycothiol system anti-sigma-R factor [Kocuria sp.]